MSLQETLTVLKALPLPIYWEMLPMLCVQRANADDYDLVAVETDMNTADDIYLRHTELPQTLLDKFQDHQLESVYIGDRTHERITNVLHTTSKSPQTIFDETGGDSAVDKITHIKKFVIPMMKEQEVYKLIRFIISVKKNKRRCYWKMKYFIDFCLLTGITWQSVDTHIGDDYYGYIISLVTWECYEISPTTSFECYNHLCKKIMNFEA